MGNQELFERIERYINNRMNAGEKAQFESELKSNSDLTKAYQEQKETQLAVELGALSESLEEIHEEVVSANRPSKTNWWAIAAGIIIILSLGIYFLRSESQKNELFATYSTTDPGLPVPMSSTDHYIFYDAMVDYKAEKYDVAIKKWKGLVRAEPKNDTLNYYVGAAYYNLNKYKEAVSYLEKVDTGSSSALRNKSQWYQILAWIQLEKKDEILAVKPHAESPYAERITEIQKALDK